MPEDRNYLLGFGERLIVPIDIRKRGASKEAAYSFEEARARLASMLERTVAELDALPANACPDGETVASITLHPEYYAKSHFPGRFLRSADLRAVGSRPRRVRPDKRSRGREPEEALTTQLFVAGKRSSFRRIARETPERKPDAAGSSELPTIERVSAFAAEERLRALPEGEGRLPIEVVLHASEDPSDRFILASFHDYLEELGLDPPSRHIFFAQRLCFLALRASALQAREVARFSFLRVVRAMTRLRPTLPVLRSVVPSSRPIDLPQREVLDANLRVALLDGGLPAQSPLTKWAHSLETPSVGPPDPDCLRHGEAVTSALLFGSLGSGAVERPLCRVDHYRVLDRNSIHDPYELFEVLDRIKSVLDQGNYEFFNISIGPEVPVDDDDVHAWTAVLDEHLADGRGLATIAAGNTGEAPKDPQLRKWRVQVPSDCVNGVAVGAADRLGASWARAPYSSLGPGRSPGIVKPDQEACGGSEREHFWVTDPAGTRAISTAGTSYAAPAALRAGLAVRAHFGPVLSALAIRALLIHRADPGSHPRKEVGWGRLPGHVDDLVICPSGSVRVVYQDEITAASYRRISIPLPRSGLPKTVRITATFCFATAVDSADPGNYTQAGLSVFFRPNASRFDAGAIHPKTAPFFLPDQLYGPNQLLRRDARKWETCLHARVAKRAKSLDEPVFDIHYNARAGGRNGPVTGRIRYALILTIEGA